MTIDLESRVRRKADIPWKELEDTIVLLDLSSGDFFELDEVGARIWSALDGALTLRELAAALGREYQASANEIESDVVRFVTDLHARDLVTLG
jgi:hypothetical protein